MRVGTPRLDFIVIGAQKAGTTSLWRYLEGNARLRMPPAKEAPFFVEPAYPDGLRAYMRALFKDAPRRARLGTVTPSYMLGVPGVPVPEVARRIRGAFPDVRLVALLRDPVERAWSAYRMGAQRGWDRRPFDVVVDELLRPAELARARQSPVESRSYVTAGEYGRMLAAYLEEFPREQLHLELTAELAHAPADVVARVCAFIGVEPHASPRLQERFHVSGRQRVTQDAERDLKDYLDRHVWPRMRHSSQHRDSFERFFEIWNVEPAPAEVPADPDTVARLRDHYAADAVTLEALTGVRVPWSRPSPAPGSPGTAS